MKERQSKDSSGILVQGVFYEDDKKYLKTRYSSIKVDGIIRIREDEYDFINLNDNYLTHFNLQVSHHKVGNVYALPRIIKNGFFTGNKEQLPDLSFDNIVVGKCVQVREYLKYKDLSDADFKYSFINIKNIEHLQDAIFTRYSKSMPHLTKEDILNLGVSLTKLKIIH